MFFEYKYIEKIVHSIDIKEDARIVLTPQFLQFTNVNNVKPT